LNFFGFTGYWIGFAWVFRVGSGASLHGLDGSGPVGTGPKWVVSSTDFFQNFLLAPVLNPSVLTGYGSDGFNHGSGRGHGLRGSDLTRPGYFNKLI
jgi:hypothetical protein